LGCDHVLTIGQGIDQMGQVSKKYDRRNNQKTTKKRCMPFCHSPRSFLLEVVSIRRSRITGKEETSRIASRGQKKKKKV
jgi:hypothetical protein